MIITVKTKGVKVKALEKNLISKDSKKSSYRIESSQLDDALYHIYLETGIWKVKVIIEDPNEVGAKKKTEIGYLEHITYNYLHILEDEKDVKKFLKAIDFKDENNILFDVYTVLTDKKFVEKFKFEYLNFSKNRIFSAAMREIYGEETLNKSQELKNSISVWSKNNCKEYDRSIKYNVFFKLLLKHTGYEYY